MAAADFSLLTFMHVGLQRQRFHKSHLFEFKLGVGRDLSMMPTNVDPLERVVTTSTGKFKVPIQPPIVPSTCRRLLLLKRLNCFQVGNTVDGDGVFEPEFSKQAQFVPSFVGLDGKVLRFFAQMTDSVPESLRDNFRDRQFTILYFLVDDSIQVIEQRKHNSGYVQVDDLAPTPCLQLLKISWLTLR